MVKIMIIVRNILVVFLLVFVVFFFIVDDSLCIRWIVEEIFFSFGFVDVEECCEVLFILVCFFFVFLVFVLFVVV